MFPLAYSSIIILALINFQWIPSCCFLAKLGFAVSAGRIYPITSRRRANPPHHCSAVGPFRYSVESSYLSTIIPTKFNQRKKLGTRILSKPHFLAGEVLPGSKFIWACQRSSRGRVGCSAEKDWASLTSFDSQLALRYTCGRSFQVFWK